MKKINGLILKVNDDDDDDDDAVSKKLMRTIIFNFLYTVIQR